MQQFIVTIILASFWIVVDRVLFGNDTSIFLWVVLSSYMNEQYSINKGKK